MKAHHLRTRRHPEEAHRRFAARMTCRKASCLGTPAFGRWLLDESAVSTQMIGYRLVIEFLIRLDKTFNERMEFHRNLIEIVRPIAAARKVPKSSSWGHQR
ncbi:predicted protein [Coccidioides posadasii str. Silveira]|uniref:Predicted protein n=1 Tax=Coccidioides posadasii (strain RMSCC 757 / Silveira) TaxID=443226 RepID=E9CWB6_COCPS|nr:predicted protein [Coccidioides posadasii str. Silveira]